MKILSILKYAKVFLLVLLFSVSGLQAFAEGENVAAEVGDVRILPFEVQNIMNSLMPMVSYHGGVKDDKRRELENKAVEEAVNRVYLLKYLQKNDTALLNVAEKEAKKVLQDIQGRFDNRQQYLDQIAVFGLTEAEFLAIQVRHVLRGEFEKKVNAEQVDGALLRAYYDDNKNMFQSGESVKVKNCFVAADGRNLTQQQMDSKKKYAEDILLLWKKGYNDVAEARCEKGTYPAEDTIFTYTPNYPFAEINAVTTGQFGGPYEVLAGYLVVQLVEKVPSAALPFTDVEENIRSIMKRGLFKKRYASIIQEMKDEVPVRYYRGDIPAAQ